MNDDALVRQLQAITQRPGPHVSLYLNTEAERELGPQEMEGRWRNLRDEVDGGTVPDKALLLLDDVVDGSHRKGDGLVAITSGEEISFRRFLGSPGRSTAPVTPSREATHRVRSSIRSGRT